MVKKLCTLGEHGLYLAVFRADQVRQGLQATRGVVRADYRPAVPAEQAVGVTQAPAVQTEQPAPEPEASS